MSKEQKDHPSISELLDDVQWNYSPEHDQRSLLSPMNSYFRGFPWDGEFLAGQETILMGNEDKDE